MNQLNKDIIMKTLLTSLIILTFTTSLLAQESMTISGDSIFEKNKIKTVFSKEKNDGFYGAFSIGYSPIDDKNALTASARGCWIMDHFFSFGIGGTAFMNQIEEFTSDDILLNNDEVNLAGGYAGIILEPILLPLKPVHLSFPVLIGVGAAGNFSDYTYFSTYMVDDFFWVVEPQAELELNLTRWFRLALYGGYRLTSKLNIEGISATALQNYSAGITIKMGLF